MNRRRKRRLRSILALGAVALAAAAYLQPKITLQELVADGISVAICVLLLSQFHWNLLPRLRRWPMLALVPVVAIAYAATVIFSIAVAIVLLVLFVTGSMGQVAVALQRFFVQHWMSLRFPIEIALGMSFILILARRIGPPRLWDLIRGSYRNPKEETRMFLFIDLRGSTPLAESLGAVRFSSLLRDIFDDLTDPVLETQGDVVGYVGDEAILSWPVKRGLAEANVLRCFQLFLAEIDRRSDFYLSQYGSVPRFRAAVHSGSIVATEVGQIRTDVALHGDALNTTARVLDECNALDAVLLMTDTVAQHLTPPPGMRFEAMGSFELRGKGEPVALTRVTIG